MKNNKIRASAVLTAFAILGGYLFSACGGEGGGSGSRINPTVILPSKYTLVSPVNGATGQCTYPEFIIHFPETKDCGIQDLNQVAGVFASTGGKSLGISQPFQYMSPNGGGCDYSFHTTTSLAGNTQYKWGILGSSAGASLNPNTFSFTTAAAGAITCGGSATSFVLQSSIPDTIRNGATNIGQFGTYNSSSESFNFDISELMRFGSNNLFSLASLLSWGQTIGLGDPVYVSFNQQANIPVLKASIRINELIMGINYLGFTVPVGIGDAVTGFTVDYEPSIPGGFTYRISPSQAGWTPGNKILFVNRSVVSQVTGQPLANPSGTAPSDYAGRFKVQ